MTELISSLISLALAVYCFAISQLVQHGQLKWMSKDPLGFWGEHSDKRKYKPGTHEPKFWLSTTWLAWATDGYHLMQLFMLILISLSLTLATGWNVLLFIAVMIGIRVIHWSARKVFKK